MKEENIRPDEMVRVVVKLREEDDKKLLVNSKKFVEVPCPACECNDYEHMFEKGGYNFVKCMSCDTLFINPRPTVELLMQYYEMSKSQKYWNEHVLPISKDSRRKHIFTPRANRVVDLCIKHNVPTKFLLDVGSGNGTFCEEVKKLNIFDKVVAVEPQHDLAEECRNNGVNVIEKPIEDVDVDDVSVITFFELLEHLYCPKDFLRSCSRIISKGSLVILTVPNIMGFELLVLGKLANNIFGPAHLNYFHPKSLSTLLQGCGFEIIEVLTPGKLDAELVRKKIIDNELNISKRPFLKHVLIDEWENVGQKFQRFLENNKLSSHLWMVARKI